MILDFVTLNDHFIYCRIIRLKMKALNARAA